jgi:hypothetical protein
MVYVSVHGKAFGYDEFGLLLNGRRISDAPLPRGFGRDIFVDSVTGDAGSSGANPDDAVSTIAIALTKTRANKGDRVIVLPGHAETISAATTLPSTAAGVQVIGLGLGRQRPLITFDTANTATFTVGYDNVQFINLRFAANFLSIAAAFTLTTAKAFRLQNCKFTDTSSVLNFLNIVKSTGAANTVDAMHLEDNSWVGLGTTSVNSFLLSANDIDGLVLRGNRVNLARTATAAIVGTISAGVLTDLLAEDNVGISKQVADTGGAFINVGGTTSTGLVRNNLVGDLSTTDLFMTASVGLTFDNNKKTGVVSASGYLLPVSDS